MISPKPLKGGLTLLDATSSRVERLIFVEYNPASVQRSLQVQGTDSGREPAQQFRLKGPSIETIKLEAEVAATDELEFPEQNANAVQFGIAPQLAALEALVNPTSRDLLARSVKSSPCSRSSGVLSIATLRLRQCGPSF